MKKEYKPTGYNSISPYFVVKDAEKLADLLKELFDASEKRRYESPEGNIIHLELQIDDSIIMMGDAGDKFPVYTHLLHVYVPDVDKTYQKALDLGCEPVYPPQESKEDPDKRGGCKRLCREYLDGVDTTINRYRAPAGVCVPQGRPEMLRGRWSLTPGHSRCRQDKP